MATDKLVCAGASENVVVVELCKNANMASIGMIIFTTSQNHKENNKESPARIKIGIRRVAISKPPSSPYPVAAP